MLLCVIWCQYMPVSVSTCQKYHEISYSRYFRQLITTLQQIKNIIWSFRWKCLNPKLADEQVAFLYQIPFFDIIWLLYSPAAIYCLTCSCWWCCFILDVLFQVTSPAPPTIVRHHTVVPKDYFGLALFVTLCCFLPLGIVALIKSNEVSIPNL